MDVFVYQAALLCAPCGEDMRANIEGKGLAPEDPDDEYSYDSDDFPKGPYPDGGGEADSPQHCDSCGIFLENPLTTDGYEYVEQAIVDALQEGGMEGVAVDTWAPFYDINVNKLKKMHNLDPESIEDEEDEMDESATAMVDRLINEEMNKGSFTTRWVKPGEGSTLEAIFNTIDSISFDRSYTTPMVASVKAALKKRIQAFISKYGEEAKTNLLIGSGERWDKTDVSRIEKGEILFASSVTEASISPDQVKAYVSKNFPGADVTSGSGGIWVTLKRGKSIGRQFLINSEEDLKKIK